MCEIPNHSWSLGLEWRTVCTYRTNPPMTCAGISLVDAASVVMALGLITFFTLRAARFVRLVDAKTLEASDYTLLVQGVPGDADVQEVCGACTRACWAHKHQSRAVHQVCVTCAMVASLLR
jgi:hypothetical protein